MQSNFLKLLFILFTVSMLSSCLDTTTTTTTTSSDASFVSMTLAGNDSVKKAVFALSADGKTIENIDSLPYNTRVDSISPTFSFKSSGKAILSFPKNHKNFKFSKGKDSIQITGKDTVDYRQALSANPDSLMSIRNYSSDGKKSISFRIKVNIHKVQPELYIWNKATDNVNPAVASSQKAILLNEKIYYYLNDGSSVKAYSSTDGTNWSTLTITGLPAATPLNDMIQFNGKLYLTRDGFNIYSSSDGQTWIKSVSTFNFKSLVFALNGQLWAVVQATDLSYHFATSSDGVVWAMIGTIPVNFPVSDFASISFSNITGKSKVLVLGGYSATGGLLKNNWSSEDGIYWVDFSTENHSLDSLAAGASVISYDKKLFLFGSVLKNNQLVRTYYRQSRDEGLSWQVPDTVYNRMGIIGSEFKSTKTYKDTVSYTSYYQPHSYQSVLVDKNNKIYVIGGKTSAGTTSDVWTGMLNRKKFIRQ